MAPGFGFMGQAPKRNVARNTRKTHSQGYQNIARTTMEYFSSFRLDTGIYREMNQRIYYINIPYTTYVCVLIASCLTTFRK